MENPVISPHKSALKRYNFSRPINTAINDGLIDPTKSFFDYDCGRGDDIKLLNKSGIQSSGWDPEFRPSAPRQKKPKISHLSCPDFEKDPHTALIRSFSVNLQTFSIRQMRYAESSNPPILHRKELFVSESHGQREKFGRLTRSEEKAGLYEETSRTGRRNDWAELLQTRGVYLKGHRLFKAKRV